MKAGHQEGHIAYKYTSLAIKSSFLREISSTWLPTVTVKISQGACSPGMAQGQ